jgi:hypothetical protein
LNLPVADSAGVYLKGSVCSESVSGDVLYSHLAAAAAGICSYTETVGKTAVFYCYLSFFVAVDCIYHTLKRVGFLKCKRLPFIEKQISPSLSNCNVLAKDKLESVAVLLDDMLLPSFEPCLSLKRWH